MVFPVFLLVVAQANHSGHRTRNTIFTFRPRFGHREITEMEQAADILQEFRDHEDNVRDDSFSGASLPSAGKLPGRRLTAAGAFPEFIKQRFHSLYI